ncbi:GPI mannosyltransferase 1 [Leptidea sinapis]|uniref:GPI mannosyltransferase 1 n=1 Tax=Leptidea sinapis TaxID=189913 RepID=UPI002123AB68|nr:GPI mannosyltransferase 1 [Leptidea sinapis]
MEKLMRLPFSGHVIIAFIIRMLFIVYANYHDKHFDLPYTDIDYTVFTDAAKHVYNGRSPYRRHTYRYSPLIAYLVLPNVFLHINFGKILFCIFDILNAFAIKKLVERQIDGRNLKVPTYCTLFWLYNPMSIAISTRGNADSVPCFFIILSLMFLQTDVINGLCKYAVSGFLLGVSIHLRLYPIVFSFPMYLSLGTYNISRKTRLLNGLLQLLPNKKQIVLAFSCIITLFALIYSMYYLYGYEFLFETYIYHIFRKDVRHNFSVLFYYTYLTAGQITIDLVKILTQLCECILLFVISLSFGVQPKSTPFAIFCQSVVLVAYNSVMTSQYFIWFLTLLPLVIHNLKINLKLALFLIVVWTFPQALWLYFAYLLEFKGEDAFLYIWMSGILFFCANIYILGQLIKKYCPDIDKLSLVEKVKSK